MPGRLHLTHPPVDATGDVRQQRGEVECNQLPYWADRVDEFLKLLPEPLTLAFAIGAGAARDERATQSGLDGRGPAAGDSNHASGFVVIALLRVVQRCL